MQGRLLGTFEEGSEGVGGGKVRGRDKTTEDGRLAYREHNRRNILLFAICQIKYQQNREGFSYHKS